MDELLTALRENDDDKVRELALSLFFTREGRRNMAQINEFENYAPCRVIVPDDDPFANRIGINYQGSIFYI